MKMITRNVACVALMFAASICFAQMYTVTDLGTLGGRSSEAFGINNYGQVVGYAWITGDAAWHAFRTAPNSPINPTTDDLGSLGGGLSLAYGINNSGQVVGYSFTSTGEQHAFRTGPYDPSGPIPMNAATDDLGTLGGPFSWAYGINDSGQVVGISMIPGESFDTHYSYHAFRTASNSHINPTTDNLGGFSDPDVYTIPLGINAYGQVVGYSWTWAGYGGGTVHAFRTSANRHINPATDDLGSLSVGGSSVATAVNVFGQVAGFAANIDGWDHAFRTSANLPINPATDDLGSLGGLWSQAKGINAFAEVVGASSSGAFLNTGKVMYNLNGLIPATSGWILSEANGINDAGQIVGNGRRAFSGVRAVLITPIYKAFVQQPINANGSSVFKATRGTVPVKFRLTRYGIPTCTLLPATVAIVKAGGGILSSVDETIYSTQADSGSNFRIDSTACQYVYSLAASSLGVGTYRVDISINGIMVGHAVFALR